MTEKVGLCESLAAWVKKALFIRDRLRDPWYHSQNLPLTLMILEENQCAHGSQSCPSLKGQIDVVMT